MPILAAGSAVSNLADTVTSLAAVTYLPQAWGLA